MSESQYRVVFVGDLVAPDMRDVVKRKLATLFGTTAGSMDRLFDSPSIVLKKNLVLDQAARFRETIQECGGFCRVETMDPVPEVVLPERPGQPDQDAVCPHCFRPQEKSDLCVHCGAKMQQDESGQVSTGTTRPTGTPSVNRRRQDRRQDLEASVNVSDEDELRNGLDRRQAHRDRPR